MTEEAKEERKAMLDAFIGELSCLATEAALAAATAAATAPFPGENDDEWEAPPTPVIFDLLLNFVCGSMGLWVSQ